jgi:hypothetical protein
MVIEPHTIHRVVRQQLPERVDAETAVAVVRRADALPPVRWLRHTAIRADRRRVGMLLQVLRDVKRIELGIHLDSFRPQARQPLRCEASGSQPDGVDAEIT